MRIRSLSRLRIGCVLAGALLTGGCTVLSASGPSARAVSDAPSKDVNAQPIKVVDVTSDVARMVVLESAPVKFDQSFGEAPLPGTLVGRGDVLDISIWEAPPATLFGGSMPAANSSLGVARSAQLPEQMIGQDGVVRVPFAGAVPAVGRTAVAIGDEIRQRLTGKAHDPQVFVKVVRNVTSNVTVVGEVTSSQRMALTAKGERLLDALASAGGVRHPVDKMTIQVTRGALVEAMPLADVIKDPQQNIRLQADDVVTLLFQPYSFTVLGAAQHNQEVPFESTGLTLSQALGRMGGLNDQRADPKGVFIFRFEDAKVFAANGAAPPATPDGRVPVIYRIDMRDPRLLFVAQTFPIKDKDVIYISNAPLADFSKFLQAVSQIIYPIVTIQNANLF